jgi:hypothetical protein
MENESHVPNHQPEKYMILYGYCGMNIGIPPRKGNISSTNCET